MDALSRWFENILPGKKQLPKDAAAQERWARKLVASEGWVPPEFDGGCVRMVVFRDHDGRGKVCVFDTKVHLGITSNEGDSAGPSSSMSSSMSHSLCSSMRNECSLTSSLTGSITNSLSRKMLSRKPSSDAELLGEMMFGSMPMKLSGNSFKIHYIRSENQLMLTSVFALNAARHRGMSSCSLNDFTGSCPLPGGRGGREQMEHSLGPSSKHDCFHYSLKPPSPEILPTTRYQSQSLNSQFAPSPSPSPSASLPLSFTTSFDYRTSPTQSAISTNGLNSSWTRRIQRARSTSFENGSDLYHKVIKPSDQSSTAARKGKKHAIGIIFSLADLKCQERRNFQEFLFSHFTLLSAHMEELREKVEEGLHRKPNTELIGKAYQSFVEDFLALYRTQRIKMPVWLSVVSCADGRRDVCRKFLRELSTAVVHYDNKDTKFFLSSLLTSVLSLHLAWVYTVSKNGGSPAGRHHDKMASKSLAVMAECLPYNPLWAQLGDLFGAVSDPLVLSRTIITGKSAPIVYRLLYILSYFIRCSEVEEGLFKQAAEMHDYLDASDVFTHESRASSTATLASDGGRHSSLSGLIHSHSLGAENPVIRPHPFGFTHSGSRSRHSSRSDSLSSDLVHGGSLSHSMLVTGSLDRRLSSHHNPGAAITSSCSSMPATPPSRRGLTCRGGGGFKPSLETYAPSNGTCSDLGIQVGYRSRTMVGHRGEGHPAATRSLPCSQKAHVVDGSSLLGFCAESDISTLVEDAHSRMPDCCASCASHPSLASRRHRDYSSHSQVGGVYSHRYTGMCAKHEECVCYGPDPKQDSIGRGPPTDFSRSLRESLQQAQTQSKCGKTFETPGDASLGLYGLSQSKSSELISSHSRGHLVRNQSGNSLGAESLPPCDGSRVHRPPTTTFSAGCCQTNLPHIGSFDSGVSCLTSITDSARYTDADGSLYSTPTRSRASSMQRRGSSTALTQSTTSRGTDASSLGATSRTGTHPVEMRRSRHDSNPEQSLQSLPPSQASPSSSLGLSSTALARPSSASSGVYPPRRSRSDAFSFACEEPLHPAARNRSLSPEVEAQALFHAPHHRPPVFFRTIEHSREKQLRNKNGGSSTNKSDRVHAHATPMHASPPQTAPTHALRYSPQPGPHPHPFHHAPLHSPPFHLHPSPAKQRSWGDHLHQASPSHSSVSQASSSPSFQPSSWIYDGAYAALGRASPTLGPTSIRGLGHQTCLRPPSRPSSVQDVHQMKMDSRSFSTPSLQAASGGIKSLQKTNSWRGLPAIDNCFSEPPDGNCPMFLLDNVDARDEVGEQGVEEEEAGQQIAMSTLGVEGIDVEESLSPLSMSLLENSPPAQLGCQLELDGREDGDEESQGGERMRFSAQFQDFTNVDMSCIDSELGCHSPPPLSPAVSTMSTDAFSLSRAAPGSVATSDFGHSLMAGLSDHYLPDFVLHGTSQPAAEFRSKLVSDLAAFVKHSVVEDPVQSGIAIVADTDSWTCQLVMATKSPRTPDVENYTGSIPGSQTVKKMLHSVKALWEMQVPPEICLSHLEDALMEMNEQGQMLASVLLEQGGQSDLSQSLPRAYAALGTHPSDRPLLLSLAGVHCSSHDRCISQALHQSFMHCSTLTSTTA